MDSAVMEADDEMSPLDDEAVQIDGETCCLGVAHRPCVARDGVPALGDDLACLFCGWSPTLVFAANLCRSAAGLAVQEDRHLVIGAAKGDTAAESAALHSDGMVGVYFVF